MGGSDVRPGVPLLLPGNGSSRGKLAQKAYARAVFRLDARYNPAGGAPTDLSPNALSVQNGSTGGADENDALHLPYTGQRYVYVPTGASQNNLGVLHAADQIPTADLDILFRVRLPAWSGLSATQIFGQKTDFTDPNRYWLVGMLNNGLPRAQLWPTGSTASVLNLDATTTTATAGLVGGATYWFRFTLDADDGAGNRVHEWFYAPDSTSIPTSWTSMGGGTAAGAITWTAAGTAPIYMPANASSGPQDLFRFVVRHAINGAAVLDWDAHRDPVNATHTAFTAATGQTVGVNRATTGRKTAVVEAPKWLLGTNDYIEVAHHPLLNFDADDNFTVLAIARSHHIPAANARFVSKRSTGAGWAMGRISATGNVEIAVNDGTWKGPGSVAITNGALTMAAAVRSNAAANVRLYVNAATSNLYTDPLPGDLSNTVPVRIGAESTVTPANYHDVEIYAVYIWREALSAAELAAIAADWGAA